ncbi:hypothetical protein [Kurthia sibirica]|uniref:Tetratricopeptide repeat protein n=1 Tax=Kurthia sibirica TaxID=202750 RepID=A0A2U3AIS7_9BACL|nr:hypothetical protein [Kurthia sibirica]PWI24456.1 hypothetical protein DEX24_13405 [Kurthia sibirica]GEK35696.1 hypothetical protein KSI01_32290 [Kurthia sibirica]
MDLIVPESDYFENKKEWQRAFEVLKQAVEEHPNESKYLCKLAFLCWYHTSESDGDRENLKESLLDRTLLACFVEGKKKFSEEVNFLVVFGQMMHLTPYLFEHESFDYFAIEKLALDYIEKACILEPDNIFIKLLFLDTREVTEKSLSEKLFEGFKKLLNIEKVQEKEYNKLNNKVAHDISNFGFSGLMLEFCKDMNLPK